MNFKDQLIEDLGVFLDLEEFGNTHNFNGNDIVAIVDNDMLEQKAATKGVYVGDLLFFAKTEDLISLPEAGNYDQIVTFDNKEYKIASIKEELGMTEVILTSQKGLRVIVRYRPKKAVDQQSLYGMPGYKVPWTEANIITPDPLYEEISNTFNLDGIGIIQQGSILLQINKPLFTKEELESYEYLVNSIEYTLVGGQVIEKEFYWNLYLKRKL